ncbi:hypothetical protein Q7P35_005577 [Cladosporium inversicolor]
MELPTARKINIICSDGDILLRGAEQGNGDLLLVSSHVLSKASESLSEILRIPQMPKVQSFPTTREITLPRDSLDALLIICNILHGRDRHVPETMPLVMLKAVAQSCSRHQLTKSLLAWSPRWLNYASGVVSKNERYVIIALAVDFGVYPPRNEPVLWQPCQSPGTTGHYLAGGLHYQKSQVMLKAVAALRNYSMDMYYVSPKCKSGHLALWEAQLKCRGLLPFESAVRECDLGGLMEALRTLAIPDLVPDCGCEGFTPRLTQNLCDAVCQTFDTSCL